MYKSMLKYKIELVFNIKHTYLNFVLLFLK